MKQGDKELLLKDLCARLPYGVKVQSPNGEISVLVNPPCTIQDDNFNFKPYLRPISSMTDDERTQLDLILPFGVKLEYGDVDFAEASIADTTTVLDYIDWLNTHHFDYRGLIEKGLALEAPEGMYQ